MTATNNATQVGRDLTAEEIAAFVYREARYTDEHDYDAWEALWTDDAIYWVPAGAADIDPHAQVSVIFDNRRRITTRLDQLRTGKRYAQTPTSNLRRVVSNLEVLSTSRNEGGDPEAEVAANFLLLESRMSGVELWGGRTTYRLRRTEDGIRLAFKKVVLVNLDQPLPTLGFLI